MDDEFIKYAVNRIENAVSTGNWKSQAELAIAYSLISIAKSLRYMAHPVPPVTDFFGDLRFDECTCRPDSNEVCPACKRYQVDMHGDKIPY